MRTALVGVLEPIGYQHFAYVLLRHGERPWPYLFSNYPDEWVTRYVAKDYGLIDPVMLAAPNRSLPFLWADLDMDERQRAFFKEAESFGIWHGLTVPIHGPHGSLALLSLASSSERPDPGPVLKDGFHRLQLLALMLHDHLCERRHITPDEVTLSPRERECLLWTARGKTAWEIAEILSIREATVVFHLKNAAKRLDVHSRFHAAVKAIMAGMIHP